MTRHLPGADFGGGPASGSLGLWVRPPEVMHGTALVRAPDLHDLPVRDATL